MNKLSIIALMAIVIVVTVLMMIVKKRTAKKQFELLKKLHTLASENDCSITHSTYWTGMTSITRIGIDTHKIKLFFVRTVNEMQQTYFVDISSLKKVTKYCSYKTVGNSKNQQTTVEKVGLSLVYRDTKRANDFLEFFNSDVDNMIVTDEVLTAEKWEVIVSNLICADKTYPIV